MSGKEKPKWLLAGGMGVIGRNLVKYLLDNKLASEIRVGDKRAPFMAFLGGDHKAALEDGAVECMQVDCADEESVDRLFAEPRSGGSWDYVVNCAAETDLSRPESFHAKAAEAARLLARAAAAGGVKRFVQVSSASVYAAGAKASGEAAKLAPWTTAAEWALKAEEAVRSTAGLPWVVLRPAIVYGPGDTAGIMPRAVIAATYKRMKDEKMEFLWGAELKMNTVHVFDVARAIFFAAKKAEAGSSAFFSAGGSARCCWRARSSSAAPHRAPLTHPSLSLSPCQSSTWPTSRTLTRARCRACWAASLASRRASTAA